MPDNTKSVANAAEDAKDDLQQLKLDLAKLSETVASLMSGQTGSARAAVSNAAAKLREQGGATYREAESRAREKAKDVEQAIVSNPFGAVAAAVGIGILLGILSRRR